MSNPYWYALLERLHGHLGWLGLAVLLHPVITLGKNPPPRRSTRLSVWLAAALMLAPYGVGWAIYPTYRSRVKPGLMREALPWAMAFETKEHLAFMAVALAVSGALTLAFAGNTEGGRRSARALLAAAWLCGLAVGILGLLIASRAHPAW
ncbi:MAG: hypothetical protein AAFV53_26220 [Myxococcota bacterium]